MVTLKRLFVAVAAAAAVATVVPLYGLAAAPVVHEHAHFTSDVYDDQWCGIAGTSVDRVVAQYVERESGASVETLNIATVFTATASGTSMLIRQTGARHAGAPVDNGDGTYSALFHQHWPVASVQASQRPADRARRRLGRVPSDVRRRNGRLHLVRRHQGARPATFWLRRDRASTDVATACDCPWHPNSGGAGAEPSGVPPHTRRAGRVLR